MINRRYQLFAFVLAMFASTLAFAQFGGLGNVIGGASSGGSGSATPGKIVSTYVKGQSHVLRGQQSMINALGLKNEEAKLVLEAKALTSNPTKSEVEASKTVIENGSKALTDAMNNHAGKMSEASKKEFSKGVESLARGVREYVTMSNDARGFKPSIGSMDSTTMAAAAIVPSLPSSIESLTTTLKAAINFMQENKMPPLEKSATAGLPGF